MIAGFLPHISSDDMGIFGLSTFVPVKGRDSFGRGDNFLEHCYWAHKNHPRRGQVGGYKKKAQEKMGETQFHAPTLLKSLTSIWICLLLHVTSLEAKKTSFRCWKWAKNIWQRRDVLNRFDVFYHVVAVVVGSGVLKNQNCFVYSKFHCWISYPNS